jgi:hypothetical protein
MPLAPRGQPPFVAGRLPHGSPWWADSRDGNVPSPLHEIRKANE